MQLTAANRLRLVQICHEVLLSTSVECGTNLQPVASSPGRKGGFMGGIRDYFHGEEADVLEVNWIPYGDYLSYTIELANNPHRKRAQAYGADIAIDPLIRPKDHVIYIRLDRTCGIWVKSGMQFSPELDAALARVAVNIERCRRYSGGGLLARLWAQTLRFSTGIKVLKQPRQSHLIETAFPLLRNQYF